MDSQKLKMLLDFLISKPEIQLAILFGSVAHKTDTAISDIDLAIAGNEKFSIDERLNISLSINKLIGKEVDLIDLMQARGAIFHSAMNTGQILFCHNTLIREKLLKRMWREKDDDFRFAQKVLNQRLVSWEK